MNAKWAAATFFATVLKLASTTQRAPLALEALVGLAYLYGRRGDLLHAAGLLTLVAQHPAVRQETQMRITRIESELAVDLSTYAAGATPSDHQEQTLWQTVEQVLVAVPALR